MLRVAVALPVAVVQLAEAAKQASPLACGFLERRSQKDFMTSLKKQGTPLAVGMKIMYPALSVDSKEVDAVPCFVQQLQDRRCA